MKKIEEILSLIDIEEMYYSPMSNNEKHKICEEVMGSYNRKKYSPKKSILIIAAAIMTIFTTVFAFAYLNLDESFKQHFKITQELEEDIFQGVQNTPNVVSHDGITISISQTISDGKNVYFIAETEVADNINLTDNHNFENISVIPVRENNYSAFSSDISVLEQINNKRKYLISSNGNTELKSGKLLIEFENLYQTNSENLIIPGKWSLEIDFDASIHTITKETNVTTEVTAFLNSIQDYKTTTVKKITLSPLSLSIDIESKDAKSGLDNIFSTYVEIHMKNGNSFYCGKDDINKNFSGDINGGNMFFRFNKVIDVDDVESISIGDKTIIIK